MHNAVQNPDGSTSFVNENSIEAARLTAGQIESLGFTFAAAAEAANVIAVTLTPTDRAGKAITLPTELFVTLYWGVSSASAGLNATPLDGGISAGTNTTEILEHVAGSIALYRLAGTASHIINLTHAAGALSGRLNVILPDGRRVQSGTITFA